jgi:hypothetical protein
LSTDLTARISPEVVEMTLVGPLPRLETLAPQEVFVYVELVDKGVGQHAVELTYLVPEGLEVSSVLPSAVDVVISRIPPTPTPTRTRTPTPTAQPTAATPTLDVSATLTTTQGITLTVTPGLTGTAALTGTPVTTEALLTATPTITFTVTPASSAGGGG